MGEGFMGGVQMAAVESLKEATAAGRQAAQRAFDALSYAPKTFDDLPSPVWMALAMESRLSDVVVFDNTAAKNRGPLSQAFEQIVATEQRPVIVVRPGLNPFGHVVLAWDGGKEAARAVRTALPLLQRARAVSILTVESPSTRDFVPAQLQTFLAARSVKADVRSVSGPGDAATLLLKTAQEIGASLLVAGAYGHPRLQEFIFGGATRSFLNAEAPALFLSH
jgi:nucleotide-binding universal stress UspA family protein